MADLLFFFNVQVFTTFGCMAMMCNWRQVNATNVYVDVGLDLVDVTKYYICFDDIYKYVWWYASRWWNVQVSKLLVRNASRGGKLFNELYVVEDFE